MATKGKIRVVGVNKDGLWIVEPIGSYSIDPLQSSLRSGVHLEVKLSAPVTKTFKPKHQPPTLRLAGGA